MALHIVYAVIGYSLYCIFVQKRKILILPILRVFFTLKIEGIFYGIFFIFCRYSVLGCLPRSTWARYNPSPWSDGSFVSCALTGSGATRHIAITVSDQPAVFSVDAKANAGEETRFGTLVYPDFVKESALDASEFEAYI